MTQTTLRFKKLHPSVILPAYATEGAAGMDLTWDGRVKHATSYLQSVQILACKRPVWLGTGLAVEVPPGFELQIRMRSSLAAKGLYIPNGVGTLDSDYRGEIWVLLMYGAQDLDGPFVVRRGDRIAQAVLCAAPQAQIEEAAELTDTTRAAGGFGSTGR